jgi:hypothetical protein
MPAASFWALWAGIVNTPSRLGWSGLVLHDDSFSLLSVTKQLIPQIHADVGSLVPSFRFFFPSFFLPSVNLHDHFAGSMVA